jgi:hypothetical protein
VFALLLGAASWLATASVFVAWWEGDATGLTTLWMAAAAGGLSLRAMYE